MHLMSLCLCPAVCRWSGFRQSFLASATGPDGISCPLLRNDVCTPGHTDLFARSGPRLVDGVEVLAHMLDPQCFSDPFPADTALKISEDGVRLEPYR